MVDIYSDVEQTKDVKTALDVCMKKHNELFGEYPSGTIHYQYTCVMAQTLLDIFAKVANDSEFSAELRESLTAYAEKVKNTPNDFPYSFSFGSLGNGKVTPASPFWEKHGAQPAQQDVVAQNSLRK